MENLLMELEHLWCFPIELNERLLTISTGASLVAQM